jgi:hypothetical protein
MGTVGARREPTLPRLDFDSRTIPAELRLFAEFPQFSRKVALVKLFV